MTWTIYALKGPGGVRRLEDMPEGYEPPSLGTADAVIDAIREVAPHLDATDPTWLRLRGPDHSVDATFGKNIEARDITFYIEGGDGAAALVVDICRRLRVMPYDTESGLIFTETSTPLVPPPLDDDEVSGGKRRWWRRRG